MDAGQLVLTDKQLIEIVNNFAERLPGARKSSYTGNIADPTRVETINADFAMYIENWQLDAETNAAVGSRLVYEATDAFAQALAEQTPDWKPEPIWLPADPRDWKQGPRHPDIRKHHIEIINIFGSEIKIDVEIAGKRIELFDFYFDGGWPRLDTEDERQFAIDNLVAFLMNVQDNEALPGERDDEPPMSHWE